MRELLATNVAKKQHDRHNRQATTLHCGIVAECTLPSCWCQRHAVRAASASQHEQPPRHGDAKKARHNKSSPATAPPQAGSRRDATSAENVTHAKIGWAERCDRHGNAGGYAKWWGSHSGDIDASGLKADLMRRRALVDRARSPPLCSQTAQPLGRPHCCSLLKRQTVKTFLRSPRELRALKDGSALRCFSSLAHRIGHACKPVLRS